MAGSGASLSPLVAAEVVQEPVPAGLVRQAVLDVFDPPARGEDPGAAGADDVELGVDVGDVLVDGPGPEGEIAGYLLVGVACGYELEDFGLAGAEDALPGAVADGLYCFAFVSRGVRTRSCWRPGVVFDLFVFPLVGELERHRVVAVEVAGGPFDPEPGVRGAAADGADAVLPRVGEPDDLATRLHGRLGVWR